MNPVRSRGRLVYKFFVANDKSKIYIINLKQSRLTATCF